jgi:hypothetical protein
MGGDTSVRERRPVLIQTLRGSVEGRLGIHPGVRTLDFLNLARRFVPVEADEIAVEGWCFEQGLLGINKDLILFVAELSDRLPVMDDRVEAAQFEREPIGLRVGDCDVRGYLHVRGVHDPVMRLNQCRQLFVAMTSASVIGPSFELAASFLAVNAAHVLAVQALRSGEIGSPVGPAWEAEARVRRPALDCRHGR